MAADDAAFRESYNKLGNILNVDDAEIIFNDEQDKFFIGTPTLVDEVDPGSNSITGEIEITCLDPLKYSVVEYEAETSIDDPGTLLVDYGGTYKAYPILEADFYDEVETDDETTTELTGNGDCGYVAFFTENEKIIQLVIRTKKTDRLSKENPRHWSPRRFPRPQTGELRQKPCGVKTPEWWFRPMLKKQELSG